MGILSQKFWRQSFERAGKTAAQVALAGIGVTATTDITQAVGTFTGVNWPMVGDLVLYSVIASFLTSAASSAFNDSETPSLVE